MKLTILENVADDVFKDSTGVSDYDDLLDPQSKEYWLTKKNRVGHIEYMSPDEYIEKCAEYGFDHKTTADKLIKSRSADTDSIESITKAINNRTKIYMPYLNIADHTQEGLHRAVACKQLGIDTMKVLVIEVADEDAENELERNKKIDTVWRAFNREVVERIERYTFESLDDLVENMYFGLDQLKAEYEYESKVVNIDNKKIVVRVDDIEFAISYKEYRDGFAVSDVNVWRRVAQ